MKKTIKTLLIVALSALMLGSCSTQNNEVVETSSVEGLINEAFNKIVSSEVLESFNGQKFHVTDSNENREYWVEYNAEEDVFGGVVVYEEQQTKIKIFDNIAYIEGEQGVATTIYKYPTPMQLVNFKNSLIEYAERGEFINNSLTFSVSDSWLIIDFMNNNFDTNFIFDGNSSISVLFVQEDGQLVHVGIYYQGEQVIYVNFQSETLISGVVNTEETAYYFDITNTDEKFAFRVDNHEELSVLLNKETGEGTFLTESFTYLDGTLTFRNWTLELVDEIAYDVDTTRETLEETTLWQAAIPSLVEEAPEAMVYDSMAFAIDEELGQKTFEILTRYYETVNTKNLSDIIAWWSYGEDGFNAWNFWENGTYQLLETTAAYYSEDYWIVAAYVSIYDPEMDCDCYTYDNFILTSDEKIYSIALF